MDNDPKLVLLQEKIDLIDTLLKDINWQALRQWREETLMILDNLIDENSKYYTNFEKIHFESMVVSSINPEWNKQKHAEAYTAGLEMARSSLNAVVYGIKNKLF